MAGDVAVAVEDGGGAAGVVFEDVGEAEDAGEVAEVDELGLDSGGEKGVKISAGEDFEAVVVAGAEADEDADNVGEGAEVAGFEVFAKPVGGPVVVALADIESGEFVGEAVAGGGVRERRVDGAVGPLVEEFLEALFFLVGQGALGGVEEVAVVILDFLPLRGHSNVVAVGGEKEQGEFVV